MVAECQRSLLQHNVLFPDSAQYYGGASSSTQRPDDLQFAQYTYGDARSSTPSYASSYGGGVGYSSGTPGPGGVPPTFSIAAAFSTGGFEGEPPLLEELGIRFDHIGQKAMSVLNFTRPVDPHIFDDTDLAGPLIFLVAFGVFLLLAGKAHFSYIYALGTVGCVSLSVVLNLMSENGVDIWLTASVLGYCTLPMVILSFLYALFHLTGLDSLSGGIPGFILSSVFVLWCTHSASLMFTTVLSMNNQRLLIAYPIALLYIAFAQLAIF
ncbi:hypothetical protein BJ742DRAFT_779310 [Cladochytrium replicatum]|nr:hypothetical protein BJ742DRAFT_779310 [Cladochytrium replicatum]